MTTLTAPAPTAAPAPAGHAPAGSRVVPVGRRLGAVALVTGAALNTAEAVLNGLLVEGDGVAERLDAIDAHPVLSSTHLVVGTLAVPLMAVGFLAAAHLTRRGAPRLSAVAAPALLAGMAGFLGLHALMLVDAIAAGLPDRAAAVALLEAMRASAWGALVLGPFLLGCVVGMGTLVAALWRSRAVPRWVAVTWGAFLVLDFGAQGATGPVDPHWLFLAGAVGVAARLLRTDDARWTGASA